MNRLLHHVHLPFADRHTAGVLLGERLRELHLEDVVVLALPRGGVPVAAAVAGVLGAPMDILLSQRIGAPHDPSVTIGAVVEGRPAQLIVDEAAYRQAQPSPHWMQEQAKAAVREIARRRNAYRRWRRAGRLEGRNVILVDDGAATGATLCAALSGLLSSGAKGLVVAVPVAPPGLEDALPVERSAFVCLAHPEPFGSIGAHYRDFHLVSDEAVIGLLDRMQPLPPTRSRRSRRAAPAP